jgi:hypothetical protein
MPCNSRRRGHRRYRRSRSRAARSSRVSPIRWRRRSTTACPSSSIRPTTTLGCGRQTPRLPCPPGERSSRYIGAPAGANYLSSDTSVGLPVGYPARSMSMGSRLEAAYCELGTLSDRIGVVPLSRTNA